MFQTCMYLKFDVQLYSEDLNFLKLFEYLYIELIQLHRVTCMFIV